MDSALIQVHYLHRMPMPYHPLQTSSPYNLTSPRIQTYEDLAISPSRPATEPCLLQSALPSAQAFLKELFLPRARLKALCPHKSTIESARGHLLRFPKLRPEVKELQEGDIHLLDDRYHRLCLNRFLSHLYLSRLIFSLNCPRNDHRSSTFIGLLTATSRMSRLASKRRD